MVPGSWSDYLASSLLSKGRWAYLEVWQLARELERGVLAFIAEPHVKHDFNFCDQIRRLSRSAPRNISEGFGRYYLRDFARLLRIALGSLNETNDHLDAGLESQYLSTELRAERQRLANRAAGAAVNLVKYLDTCKGRRPPPRKKRPLNPKPGNPEPLISRSYYDPQPTRPTRR
jgi:four helix bundle protein